MSFLRASLAAALVALLVPVASAAARNDETIPDAYIVVYKSDVDSVDVKTDDLEKREGFKSANRYSHALKGFSATLSPGQLKKVTGDPDVAYVTPDRVVHADASPAPGEPLAPTGVRRMAAADATTVHGASSVNVAVIDTGIDLSHPDLNAVAGKNCVNTGAAPVDDNGHGSHVSGTIAARNNGSGVVGVAPDTRLVAVKVLNSSGSGTSSQVICGIDYVTATRTDSDPDNDVYVANMSLGGTAGPTGQCGSTSDAEFAAICRSVAAGVTYVVAAGNSGYDFDYAPQPDVPANYPNVLTVTAVSDSDGQPGALGPTPSCRRGEYDDRYASFSNYAATAAGQAHTIAGPGVCIFSTWMNGGYNTISGTSMATPHLTGAVALCLGEDGAHGPCWGLTPAQIITKMRADAASHATADPAFGFTGDPAHPVSGRYFGFLEWVGLAPAAADTTPPTVTGSTPSGSSVNPASAVTVTFSEPMDQTATGGAFSLTGPNNTTVNGTKSWNGNTLTFTPASALAGGATYTAGVSTAATDAAGNHLAGAYQSSFTTSSTAAHVIAHPGSVSNITGSYRAGSVAGLAAAGDGQRYDVSSTGGSAPTAGWQGNFSGVASNPVNATITYRGLASRSCSQTVSVLSGTTWVTLGTRTTSSDATATYNIANAAQYVSGGQLAIRVQCKGSRNKSFYISGDLLELTYDTP